MSHQLHKYPLLIKGGTSKSTQTMSSNGNIIYKWLMFAKFDSRRVFSRRIFWLVVYLPLWKIWQSVGIMKFPIYGKKNHVPNHQPDLCFQLIIKKIPSLCQGTIRGNVQPRDTCDPWNPCDPWPSWPMLKVWWQSPQIHIYLTRSDSSGYSSASCCPGI